MVVKDGVMVLCVLMFMSEWKTRLPQFLTKRPPTAKRGSGFRYLGYSVVFDLVRDNKGGDAKFLRQFFNVVRVKNRLEDSLP